MLLNNVSLGTIAMMQRRAVTVDPNVITAVVMGQSELEYLFNATTTYRQITQPTPGNGNLIVFRQNGKGVAPVRTVVNPTTVAAGQVNPAMAAISAFLAYAAPDKTFVLGDGAVPGTSRGSLGDDSTDATDDRLWSDFTVVAGQIETEFGKVDNLIECWYNADAALIGNFRDNFWPLYFGTYGDGTEFTLGTVQNGRSVDHCLYDGIADPADKGRGLFSRADTDWHILTPMPFLDGETAPAEQPAFSVSSSNLRNKEPNRAVMHELATNSLAQSVNIKVGPSAHITKWDGIHPVVKDSDGQILLGWPVAIAMLRAAGQPVHEPTIHSCEVAPDGSYADLVIDLPNGGDLTTLAELRGTSYAGSSPHQQEVTGVEILRAANGNRAPVFKTTETSRAEITRGTVEIIDAGSGIPRRGKVRITPELPFEYGDALSYLRGQASAVLQRPRDEGLYPWFLVEHIPSLYDENALYPFEGVAIRPYQEDIAIPLEAPAFTGRSAHFDGSTRYNGPTTIEAGSAGLVSLWYRYTEAAWNSPTSQRIFQLRVGGAAHLELITTGAGRLNMRISNDTATDTMLFYSAQPGNVPHVPGGWYHALIGWTDKGASVYVNDKLVGSLTFNSLDFAGLIFTQYGIGGPSSGMPNWFGDLGHVYVNLNETLDLSIATNREKFIKDGKPVNLGDDGSLPTGNAPPLYYDGIAPAWNNKGTAGNVTLTGTLTEGSVPEV